MNTPRRDNFFMPAEWHQHHCCWMGWPYRAESWSIALSQVQATYLKVAQAIAQFEPVKIIVPLERAKSVVQLIGKGIEIVTLPIDDIWLRDTGPTFVINNRGQVAGVDWQFNAWGESRENLNDYQQDTQLAQHILEYLRLPRYAAPLVLEGGAIHTDGEGTVLVTEECLLNPNRNPHLTRTEIEVLLQDYLGITRIIWLGQGLQDDETAGHIDNLANFARPGVVIALTSSDPQDSNYWALQDNLRRLQRATDAQNRRLEIITIEQPARRNDPNGLRLSLSYLNFYLANGGIIVPIFNDPADHLAITILTKVFPHYQIVPIDALDLSYGGGNIHCITQQQPLP